MSTVWKGADLMDGDGLWENARFSYFFCRPSISVFVSISIHGVIFVISKLFSRKIEQKVLSFVRTGGQGSFGRHNESSIIIILCLVVENWNAISYFQNSAKNVISSFYHYDLYTCFETFYIIHSWRIVCIVPYEQNVFCSIAYRPSRTSQEHSRWPYTVKVRIWRLRLRMSRKFNWTFCDFSIF